MHSWHWQPTCAIIGGGLKEGLEKIHDMIIKRRKILRQQKEKIGLVWNRFSLVWFLTSWRVSTAWFSCLSSLRQLKLCVVEQSDTQLCCLVEDESMQCFLKWSLLPDPQIFWYYHFGKSKKASNWPENNFVEIWPEVSEIKLWRVYALVFCACIFWGEAFAKKLQTRLCKHKMLMNGNVKGDQCVHMHTQLSWTRCDKKEVFFLEVLTRWFLTLFWKQFNAISLILENV